MKFTHICVIGLGYIGLPTSAMFATHGIKVTGVDNNPEVVAALKDGKVHIYEPGLSEIVKSAAESGMLTAANHPVEADAFIIAVPTPFYGDKKADLSFVRSAAESIVPVLRQGNLVVLESTSPPLTTETVVRPILEQTGLVAGKDFLLAYSPERVLPGRILEELISNARVIGGIDGPSAEAGRDLYGTFVKGDIILTNATTSEMVKLMENTYRDVNIAIANEFSRLADRFGVDVWEAIQIANLHPRVKILSPGPGVGGHCISVDPWFFVEAAPDLTPLIHTAREVNDSQPEFVLKTLENTLGTLEGKHIAVLGLAFKPDVDDLRESPAVEAAHLFAQAGAQVSAYEPFKPDFITPHVRVTPTLSEAIENADALVLLVGHAQFKALDPQVVRAQTHADVVLDTVNGWNYDAWTAAGFKVVKLGKGQR